MKRQAACIVREYGPFPGIKEVGGVTYDGQHVWFAAGDRLQQLDPASGKMLRAIDVAAHAGTAFDGRYLYQIAEKHIHKIDPQTGQVLATHTISGFREGVYVVFRLSGNVLVRVSSTVTSPPNTTAVVSGIFFGGPATSGIRP